MSDQSPHSQDPVTADPHVSRCPVTGTQAAQEPSPESRPVPGVLDEPLQAQPSGVKTVTAATDEQNTKAEEIEAGGADAEGDDDEDLMPT